jgi:hypothetical protein
MPKTLQRSLGYSFSFIFSKPPLPPKITLSNGSESAYDKGIQEELAWGSGSPLWLSAQPPKLTELKLGFEPQLSSQHPFDHKVLQFGF